MSSTSILVVGGAGYIGSHTSKVLRDRGFHPVVLDNLCEGHDWAVKFGPLVKANAGDSDAVRHAIREHKIQAVIHFAACAYVGESVTNPRKYFANNVTQMQALLDSCVEEGVKNVIFSSSCATYGVPSEMPIREDMPQVPINPYGDTKLIGEKMLHWYAGAYDLRFAALRYFNASGADPDGEIGEVHDPETHLIPLVMHGALGKRPPVKVFGTDYPTPDGTAVRDYIHVMDLADAHIRATEALLDGSESMKLNLGTGVGTSVKEVIEVVGKVSGREVPHEFAPRRPGDPPALYADPRLAVERIGWKAKFANIEEICRHAWNWEQIRLQRGL